MEIQNNNQNNQHNNNKIAGTVFVGCMFLGMGAGMFFGKMAVGLFIGMGVGFIASAITRAKL